MNRRAFMQWVGALVSAAAFSCAVPRTDVRSMATREESIRTWSGRIRRILSQGTVPIIDPEATYWHAIDIKFIVREMDRLGVAQVAFAPKFFLGSATSLELHQRYPEYFIPTTADGSSWHWDRQPQEFIDQVIAEFKSGKYFMMGEYEIRHYPSPIPGSSGQMHMDRDITVPWDTKALHDLFRFSEEYRVAFLIHYEIEDALLPQLEKMLASYPGAQVIWAHLGQIRYPNRAKRYGPDYVESLISRFPNLYFDLGGMVWPGHVYPGSGARDNTLFEFTGSPPYGGYLKREWRDLLNIRPERFLAATDMNGERWPMFPKIIDRFRNLILGQLSERARHLIAYQNAWKLIAADSWRS
jgi:hypothetical protein